VNVDLVCATPVGEEEEEALLHAAISVELGPPTVEVALAFTIVEDLQLIWRLAAATLRSTTWENSLPSMISVNLEGRQRSPNDPASTGIPPPVCTPAVEPSVQAQMGWPQ
jgi:hypothetical protein